MTLKLSTGLRNGMLTTGSLTTQLAAGFINIYAGTVPASADAALDGTNTLLATISNNSTATGLTLNGGTGAVAAGVVGKTSTETWTGLAVASGTATFYRHVGSADDGALSTTEPRIQGSIATAGAEMNLTSTAIVAGATETINYYSVALPTL